MEELTIDNPHIKHILIVGGFPCQDLSGLNRTAVGLEGARSSLLYEIIKVEKIVQQLWPEAFIESIWENVASMSEVERDKITKLKGSEPLRACPSGHRPMARPRFFWMRDEVEVGSGMLVVKKKKYMI